MRTAISSIPKGIKVNFSIDMLQDLTNKYLHGIPNSYPKLQKKVKTHLYSCRKFNFGLIIIGLIMHSLHRLICITCIMYCIFSYKLCSMTDPLCRKCLEHLHYSKPKYVYIQVDIILQIHLPRCPCNLLSIFTGNASLSPLMVSFSDVLFGLCSRQACLSFLKKYF